MIEVKSADATKHPPLDVAVVAEPRGVRNPNAVQAAPAPASPPPPVPAGLHLDWASIVGELQAMAEDSLGNRARKVKDILGAADPSTAGIEAAIDQVPSIPLLFADSSRLDQLAQEMRARLKSHA